MAESQRQRLAPRVRTAGRPAVRVRSTLAARLLDLSLSGARIEHLDLLRPGFPCTVELPAAIGALVLSGQIAWSSIVGSEPTPEGERLLRYESGLAFLGVTADQQTSLASALERLISGMDLEAGRLSP